MRTRGGRRGWSVRDNLAIYPAAVVAVILEAFLLANWWAGGASETLFLDRDHFLLFGHVYVLVACGTAYALGRRMTRPLEGIFEAIAGYGAGRLDQRIPPQSIQELDELASHLNTMAARLAELDRMKSDLVANVSHELRSPLAAMEGYLSLLAGRPGLDAQDLANVERTRGNLARLQRLVENLLDASELESRGARLHDEPVDLAALVRDVCVLCEPACRAAGSRIEISAPNPVPTLETDPGKVRQILTNLIDNAIKFGRPGGTVRVVLSASDGACKVAVEDDGPGISEDQLPLLFERFRRLPGAGPRTARIKGVGIGLSLSRGLARALGGDINVSSSPGRGSAFTLVLPLRRSP